MVSVWLALALRVSALCPKNYGVLYRTALVDTPLDAVPPETFSRSRSGKANAEGSLALATVRMNTKGVYPGNGLDLAQSAEYWSSVIDSQTLCAKLPGPLDLATIIPDDVT